MDLLRQNLSRMLLNGTKRNIFQQTNTRRLLIWDSVVFMLVRNMVDVDLDA